MENTIKFLKEIQYVNQKLHIENVNFEDIIAQYQTPLCVFSPKTLLRNITDIKCAFSKYYPKTRIHYAIKACYLDEVCEIIQHSGICVEILSDLEFAYAKQIGFQDTDIVFNGCAKTEKELDLIINNDIRYINCDSFSEIKKIDCLAKRAQKIKDICLRVHPDLSGRNLFVEKGEKMGVDIKSGEVLQLIKKMKKLSNINLIGLSCHILANEVSPYNHGRVAQEMCKLYNLLLDQGIEIKAINLGGGFNSNFLIQNAGYSMNDFAAQIADVLKKYDFSGELLIEPGRFLVNDSLSVITKVITKKRSLDNNWILVDAGTNVLIPTRHNKFYPIACNKKRGKEKINVGDGIGSTAGVISRNIYLYSIQEGEYILVLNSGSYTLSMSENFVYLKPAVVMIDKDQIRTIAKGTTLDEFIQRAY